MSHRTLIETVNDQLKNVCQIEHTRHRSPINCITHLIAYTTQPKRPHINLDLPRDQLTLTFA